MRNETRTNLAILGLILGLIYVFLPIKSFGATLDCTTLQADLRRGISSKEVPSLQKFLISQGFLNLGVNNNPTEYFGTLTYTAVRNFQGRYGIQATGNVGPLTRAKIKEVSCKTVVEVIPAPTPTVTPTPVVKVEEKIKLPYNSINFNDWAGTWGKISTTTDTLEMRASDTTGAQVQLKNSSDLTNYRINANVFIKQGTVTLMARYVNENNFLACTFSGRYIEIIQKVDGKSEVVSYASLEEIPYSLFFYNDINLSMKVNGNYVGCTAIGSEDNVTFKNVNPKLLKGGVGIQTWLSSQNVASIDVKNIKITDF